MLKRTSLVLMLAAILTLPVSAQINTGAIHLQIEDPTDAWLLGPGTSLAYGIVKLGAPYQLNSRLQLFVQINNAFNHRYYTAAQLSTTPFDNNGVFIPRPFAPAGGDYSLRSSTFFAPGAPIQVFGGLKIKLW